MDNKFIILARAAKEEGNYEDAKKYYEIVKTEDPFNPEAKFYYQYFTTMTCKNGEIASKYQQLYKCVEPTFKLIKSSEMTKEEKFEFVSEICEIMDETGESLWEHLNGLGDYFRDYSIQVSSDRRYIKCILDKIIIDVFGEEDYKPLLVELWKKQLNDAKYPFYFEQMTKIYLNLGYDTNWPEILCSKIQESEPDYVRPMPEVSKGCLESLKEEIEKAKKNKNDK